MIGVRVSMISVEALKDVGRGNALIGRAVLTARQLLHI